MERPYLIDKPLGATPLQALELLREAGGIVRHEKLAYAGRLDPLASGLLAVLHGDQLRRQEEYWYLPKQYEAEIVFGVSTDSYDLMGMPILAECAGPASERMTSVIQGMVGKIDLSVPLYSSQRYQGRALFAFARMMPDKPIGIPVRRMSVSQIDVKKVTTVPLRLLVESAYSRVLSVCGDFRQKDICAAWRSLGTQDQELMAVRLDIHCGSGTYIRSIAHEIGRRLGTGAVLSSLRRVRIGGWRVTDDDVTVLSWPR